MREHALRVGPVDVVKAVNRLELDESGRSPNRRTGANIRHAFQRPIRAPLRGGEGRGQQSARISRGSRCLRPNRDPHQAILFQTGQLDALTMNRCSTRTATSLAESLTTDAAMIDARRRRARWRMTGCPPAPRAISGLVAAIRARGTEFNPVARKKNTAKRRPDQLAPVAARSEEHATRDALRRCARRLRDRTGCPGRTAAARDPEGVNGRDDPSAR